jgi:imidazolonepropionase-like amidohydrolase
LPDRDNLSNNVGSSEISFRAHFFTDAELSAIVQAAKLLGLASEIGALAVDKSADIIALDGNPLDDIRATERVRFVMARGAVIRQD